MTLQSRLVLSVRIVVQGGRVLRHTLAVLGDLAAREIKAGVAYRRSPSEDRKYCANYSRNRTALTRHIFPMGGRIGDRYSGCYFKTGGQTRMNNALADYVSKQRRARP